MRKIEFRGKRVDNGEWVYGYYLCVEEYNEHFISQRAESGGIAWIEVHPSTIGQNTGLHDRHGKPIYEGDVVRHPNGIKFVVEWDETACAFRAFYSDNDSSAIFLQINERGQAEIIGNIHKD